MLNLTTTTKPTPAPGASLHTQVNTEGNISPTADRNFAYYEKLRRDLGARFYDVKIQRQMHKDALEQGEKFYT